MSHFSDNARFKGLVCGALAAASYGLNPLFALPLYAEGLTVDSVLFYRYGFAVLLIALLMKLKGYTFSISKNEVPLLFGLGLLFSASSLLLFQSYNLMDAGIVSTLLFVYPVMVALIMALFFHERLNLVTVVSIGLALTGISMLYKGGDGQSLNFFGVVLVMLSSLTYAVYMVWINRSRLQSMPTLKLTFYILLFGSIVYVVRLQGLTQLQPLTSFATVSGAFALALFPTIISLVMLTLSIHYIGSTPAAILGALEPVTALACGVLVFGEQLTPRILMGVALILAGVTLIVAGKPMVERARKLRLIRHRG